MEVLFRAYYSRLCHFAWQIVGVDYAVEDVVQDAFIAYWSNKDHIADNDTATKNFLYSTVRNACYNILRRQRVADKYAKAHETIEIEDPQILAKIIRTEVMHEILRIIQTMPDNCQQIFRMGYLEGLRNPEIAAELQISVNTVKTQKKRGLKILRDKLDPEFFILVSAFLIR